jgi:hypothetical protein
MEQFPAEQWGQYGGMRKKMAMGLAMHPKSKKGLNDNPLIYYILESTLVILSSVTLRRIYT